MNSTHALPMPVAALRGEFHDAAAEQAFLRLHLADTHAQLRLTFILCSLFYLLFAVTDLLVAGYTLRAAALVAVRVSVAAVGVAGLVALRRHPDSIVAPRVIASVMQTAGCSAFLLIAALRPEEFQMHAVSMVIVIIVVYIYIPNRLLYASAIALAHTLAFLWLARQLGGLAHSLWISMSMLLLLANVFGYVAARRYQLVWRGEFSTQAMLKNLSVRDPLTGCYNRRHLHQQLLETEIQRAQRYQLSLTVVMCDIDHFKQVNDSHGHHGGDAVLQAYAAMLLSTTRDNIDSVVRYGGEEFLLILPETDLDGGVQLAERLRQLCADTPTLHNGRQIAITASFGVASADFSAPGPGPAPEAMVAAADTLLYQAKRSGRNRVCSRQLETDTIERTGGRS
ncbi:diguanylate cyclase [Oxalobacteraceae bacterium A2-2]